MPAHGFRLVEHAEVGPRLRQLAFLQVQFADLPAGLADGLFVLGVRAFGQFGGGAGRDRRDAELLALLHEQRIKETGIVFIVAQTFAQAADGGVRSLGGERAFEFVEESGIHESASWCCVG